MNKKVLLAIFASALMFSSVFGMLSYLPGPSHSTESIPLSPDLSSISETASTSLAVSYYTESAASDITGSGSLTSQQNSSSYSTSENVGGWNINSAETEETISFSLPSAYYLGDVGVGYTGDQYVGFQVDANEVNYVQYNISFSSTGYTYHSGQLAPANSPISDTEYFYMTACYGSLPQEYGSPTITINVYAVSGEHYTTVFGNAFFAQVSSVNSDFYGDSTSSVSDDYGTGYHYGSSSVSLNPGTNPASYDISWSSPVSFSVTYDSSTQTGTSGSYTASLSASPSISFTTDGDPETTDHTLTFSYTLSNIELVSSASATQTASPTYTFTQVSGTTNQANSSFSFSGSTPSVALNKFSNDGKTCISMVDEPLKFLTHTSIDVEFML